MNNDLIMRAQWILDHPETHTHPAAFRELLEEFITELSTLGQAYYDATEGISGTLAKDKLERDWPESFAKFASDVRAYLAMRERLASAVLAGG